MTLKIEKVTAQEPWDAFKEEMPQYCSDESGENIDVVLAALQEYTAWLERKGVKMNQCVVCERKFKNRKKGVAQDD